MYKTRPGILCCFMLVLCFGWFGVCCLASLSFTSLFFSEFSSLGILGCALGVPGVHLSSGVCTVSSVFFHQILLYCLLLLGASLHLCLALPHPWLSVGRLVVVCHRRNIKRFFLQIHNSKFPPHCFAVSTLCNWCLIFRIFLCASMFVHASMRLNQKNATLCGQQITQTKNSTKRVSLPEGSTKWCYQSLSFVEPRRTKWSNMSSGVEVSVVRGTWYIKTDVLARSQKNNLFYERTRSLIRRDHNGGWTTENK